MNAHRSINARRSINAVDVHVAGEAGRVLIDSRLQVEGADMAARLQYCREHLDDLRRLVLTEPRGYPGLLGAIVLAPVNPGSDFGIVILEQSGFAAMSGANLIGTVTALVETGQVPVTDPITDLTVDTAAGTVGVRAEISAGRATKVTIENVPAFAVVVGHVLQVPDYGPVPVDVAFGGQYYVQARAESLGVELVADSAQEVIRAGNALLAAAREEFDLTHPWQPGPARVDLPMIHTDSDRAGVDGKGVVVMPHADPVVRDSRTWRGGTLDRSPGGTGTCARMAVTYARGELGLDQPFVHESILGTTFTGELREVVSLGEAEAVVPAISGRGWVTRTGELVLEADDPFPSGYTLGDIWGPAVRVG